MVDGVLGSVDGMRGGGVVDGIFARQNRIATQHQRPMTDTRVERQLFDG